VEYWNRTLAVEPSGLTVPLSVAPVPELAMKARASRIAVGAER
jgi:hypothetical protein